MSDESLKDESNGDELPPIFQGLTPRPAPGELRTPLLAAVVRELTHRPRPARPRWEKIFELAVAASLLVGVGLQVWRWRAERDFQARIFGAPATSRDVADIAAAVESVTDRRTAQLVREQLQAARRRGSRAEWASREYQELIEQLSRETRGTAT